MKRFLITGVFSLSLAAGLSLGDGSGPPSPILLPAGRPSVVPAHRLHGGKVPSCLPCHPKAGVSAWASDRLTPEMEQCAPCHPAASDVTATTAGTESCAACHGRLKPGERPLRGLYPRPNIRFSHKAHAGKSACGSCHPRAAAEIAGTPPPGGTGRDIAGMRSCYPCHLRTGAPDRCVACHIADKDGLMATQIGGLRLLPPTWLKGETHGPTWIARHAPMAGDDSRFCGACHREAYCQSCHTGRLRPRELHPGDWIATHGISTRLDNPRCKGCHRKQSFCITCHRRSGVAPDSPKASRAPGGGGRYHGELRTGYLMRRAKHDIASCVSCHNESSCITCHARQNPHPPGFRHKCKALAQSNGRACVKCHSDEARLRCD